MTDTRIRVGVLFGGRSCEHEVSLRSAKAVLGAMDQDSFDPIPIGVTKDGEWVTMDVNRLAEHPQAHHGCGAVVSLLPDPSRSGLVALDDRVVQMPLHDLDVMFPLIHGPLGEDGTVQGLLELADLAYVGCRVLASALAMDKAMAKTVLESAGLCVSAFRVVTTAQWRADPQAVIRLCEQAFPYPWFVKPARAGSSIGVSRVANRGEIEMAITLAGRFDTKLLVEAAVLHAREIEVAVIGNHHPRASLPGEVRCSAPFYDYEAKYVDADTELLLPADLSAPLAERIRLYALRAFKALDCRGMARVDFLVRGPDEKVFLSEVNTVPGFTPVSMFPRLWEVSGMSFKALVTRLIDLALETHFERRGVQSSYFPSPSSRRTLACERKRHLPA